MYTLVRVICLSLLIQPVIFAQGRGTIKGKIEMSQVSFMPQNSRRVYGHTGHTMGAQNSDNTFANVVIYLEEISPKKNYPPGKTTSLNQKNAEFIPKVLPILKGTTVTFRNDDDMYHNVFSLSEVKKFNIGRRPKGENVPVVFDKAGEVRVFCDIHSQMSAFILVLENPYFIKPNDQGDYIIHDVPAGTYRIKIFHPKLKCEPRIIEVGEKEMTNNFTLR